MPKAIIPAIKLAGSPSPKIHPLLANFDLLPDSSFVPEPVVSGIQGCSSATTWRRVKSGQLVAPHRIGARTTRWNVGELRNFFKGEVL